jgi:hypothetical protein
MPDHTTDEEPAIPDDPTVLDEHSLWRRVTQLTIDAKVPGGVRPSTANFQNSSDGSGMSVTHATDFLDRGGSSKKYFEEYSPEECRMIAVIPVKLVRKLNQGVIRNATQRDPHHCEVVGKKTKSVQKKILKGSNLISRPD